MNHILNQTKWFLGQCEEIFSAHPWFAILLIVVVSFGTLLWASINFPDEDGLKRMEKKLELAERLRNLKN